MALFTLTIDQPGRYFGETRAQERVVILEALQAAVQSFGTAHTHDGGSVTGSIQLSGHRVVGSRTHAPEKSQTGAVR
jgi:hypothetical protein